MTYDGSALKDADASISGFVSGEDATIVATGSQVNAGTSDNTYTITWTSAKESNYSVTESLGTLEVTKADAEVSSTILLAE